VGSPKEAKVSLSDRGVRTIVVGNILLHKLSAGPVCIGRMEGRGSKTATRGCKQTGPERTILIF